MKPKLVLVLSLIICITGCCNRRNISMPHANKDAPNLYMKDVHSIYFAFNKAAIEGQSGAKINELIAQLKKAHNATVVMYGYTDRLGQDAYNRKLAMRRISEVKKLLNKSGVIKAKNISIEAKAVGERDPLISYDTINNNPRSRRVDVFITQ